MFGKILSTAFKTVTLPIDAVNASLDVITGGDGDKEDRTDIPLTGHIERIRDAIAETMEDIDE